MGPPSCMWSVVDRNVMRRFLLFMNCQKKVQKLKGKGKGKGKAIPLQSWTGPEGSRRFRLPDFKTIST